MAQSQPHWQTIVACLTQQLQQYGFDIVHAFPVQLFNAHSPSENQLPNFSRPQATLAVIIGNTNSLWLPFLRHLAEHPQLQSQADPLDAYMEQHVTAAVRHCCQCCTVSLQAAAEQHGNIQNAPNQLADHHASQPCISMQQQSCDQEVGFQHDQKLHYELRFSHQSGPKFINMLRAAQLSGLAYYSATTHLCMHPVYGPWFALRAVAVFDCEGPDPNCYSQLLCPHPDLEQQAGAAMKQLEELGGLDNWQQHWKQWADLRSIGGKYTDPRYCYSPEQLEYHYTKSKAVLADAVNKLQQEQHAADQNDTSNALPADLVHSKHLNGNEDIT